MDRQARAQEYHGIRMIAVSVGEAQTAGLNEWALGAVQHTRSTMFPYEPNFWRKFMALLVQEAAQLVGAVPIDGISVCVLRPLCTEKIAVLVSGNRVPVNALDGRFPRLRTLIASNGTEWNIVRAMLGHHFGYESSRMGKMLSEVWKGLFVAVSL